MAEKKREWSLSEIKTVRDELNVQAHLLQAEAKNEWEQLEKKWDQVRRDIGPAVDKSVEDISAASDLLLDELEEGYKRLRNVLTKS